MAKLGNTNGFKKGFIPWNKGTKGLMPIPWNKGKHLSKETKNKIGEANKKYKSFLGHKHTPETKEKMRIAKLGKTGELSNRWKGELCKKRDVRNDGLYANWRYQVYRRDKHICRINNNDCFGKVEAHHILSFTHYPELRYNINNGITLCQAHHPLKRAEEKRLIPFFQGLVSVSNKLICSTIL
jgi:hypothetical protein